MCGLYTIVGIVRATAAERSTEASSVMKMRVARAAKKHNPCLFGGALYLIGLSANINGRAWFALSW